MVHFLVKIAWRHLWILITWFRLRVAKIWLEFHLETKASHVLVQFLIYFFVQICLISKYIISIISIIISILVYSLLLKSGPPGVLMAPCPLWLLSMNLTFYWAVMAMSTCLWLVSINLLNFSGNHFPPYSPVARTQNEEQIYLLDKSPSPSFEPGAAA